MESAGTFLCVLASSSLWLAASGLVLWLCRRLRLSPGTRAAASLLVVLQGWIWIGIPVQFDAVWIQNPAWIPPLSMGIPAPPVAPIDDAGAPTPLPVDSRQSFAASSVLPPMWMAVAAIWVVGIASVLWRSISAFVALSRLVQTLPIAPVEWQNELSALCGSPCDKPTIRSPLDLKVSNVAAPMLVQTWGRTCIVFPAWLWESCTAGQRRSILLHELAHYRRGDIWRQLAVRLLVLPHWFNPVAWWAVRQFEAASEAACDEAACGDDPLAAVSYSKALLVLNELVLNDRLGIRYAQALAVSGGSLTERIRRVLHPEFRKESQMSRVLILSVMFVLAGLAMIRIQAVGQSPPENKSAENESGERKSAEVARLERAKAPAESLLYNGGFEELREDSDEAQSWGRAFLTRTAGHFLVGLAPQVAHSGQRSALVAIGESHPDLQVAYNWTTVVQGWQTGQTYELSGWIKTENVKHTAFIMAQFWSEEGKEGKMIGGATTQFTSPVKGTTDWTRVSTPLTVPEGTGVVRIRAGLASQNNPGAKAWFDDISLVPVSAN